MSHVVRCRVLDAEMEHRLEWLKETMDYMAERYPDLKDADLGSLWKVGRQFIQPPIAHGQGNNAMTRPEDGPAQEAGEAAAPGAVETPAEDAPSEGGDERRLQAV